MPRANSLQAKAKLEAPDAIAATVSCQDPIAGELPLGLANISKRIFEGADLRPLGRRLIDHVKRHGDDAVALMDLSRLLLLTGDTANGEALQARALSLQRTYCQPAAAEISRPLRLLAFMAPGDLMTNTPIEFLLQHSNVELHTYYVLPDEPLGAPMPDHDLACVAINESDRNQPLLAMLEQRLANWPRTIVNLPGAIAKLTRDGTYALLHDIPGVFMPPSVRLSRDTLARAADRNMAAAETLPGFDFPIIVRPIASHAGHGLLKIEEQSALSGYLSSQAEDEFYVSPFVDYRSGDGLFRKYRIVLIGGRPYACHMAISQHWMIHYLNAGMTESVAKRAEEARFMESFDADFARRHGPELRSIAARLDLDYFGIDCGETKDGRLLIFEADVGMIVHDMDPVGMFPYKQPQMQKVFRAFRDMLWQAA